MKAGQWDRAAESRSSLIRKLPLQLTRRERSCSSLGPPSVLDFPSCIAVATASYSCWRGARRIPDRSTGIFTIYDKNKNPLAEAATNSYAANHGVGVDLDEELDDFNGMFSRNSRIRFADVIDGASNTIAIGERGSFFTRAQG